jgi:hypothetical protein
MVKHLDHEYELEYPNQGVLTFISRMIELLGGWVGVLVIFIGITL